MSATEPRAIYEYQVGHLNQALDFFKRTRGELSTLRKCRVWLDRIQLFDVNGEFFEIRGMGYSDTEIVPILKSVNTVFRPERIHLPVASSYKEFKTSRRFPWAEDRVM